MISAFAKGAQILENRAMLRATPRPRADARNFLHRHLWREADSTLLRRYRDGDAAIEAFLDDYACLINALVDLYETTFDPGDLAWASQLAERAIALFEDTRRRRILQLARRAKRSGAPAQGRLRRRRAFRQLGRWRWRCCAWRASREATISGRQPSARSKHSRERCWPAARDCRRCWWRRCSPWASRWRSCWREPQTNCPDAGRDPQPLSAQRRSHAGFRSSRGRCRRSTAGPPPTFAKTTPASCR